MKLVVNENKSRQIFNCLNKIANQNGYEIVDSYLYSCEYDVSYSLYKKCSWISKILYKKPIFHFDYNQSTMYIFGVNECFEYHDILKLVNNLFVNIEGLIIKIDKNYTLCD